MPMPDTSKKAVTAIQTAVKVLQRDANVLKSLKLGEAKAMQTMIDAIEKALQVGLKETGTK